MPLWTRSILTPPSSRGIWRRCGRPSRCTSRPFLEDCLEEWALSERETRSQECLTARQTLAAAALAAGEFAEAIPHLRVITAAEPFQETAQRDLMTALAGSGDWGAAILAYRTLRLLLQRELRAEPDPETRALYQRLRAEAHTRAENPECLPSLQGTQASQPPVTPTGHLPRPLTEIVGRAREARAVRALLLQSRLVTLTGAGGVGKTRLSLRVAEEGAAEQPGGAWFVDLAPLQDAALVPQAVALLLGVKTESGRSCSETLAANLRDQSLLLILDNCEHVLAACATLAASLLAECPALRVLATSRQALRVTGETVWVVPSLSVPPLRESMTAEVAARADAVRLFVERAASVLPGFTLTDANAPAIVQICQHLDGIPLALELAAARVRMLSPEQIAARLDDRFRLLTLGSRAALPRHQTLRALLDWSYDLLSEPERRLLRTLSVFSGGWTLDAAETVCPPEGEADALETLTALEEKSLVVTEADDGPERRYRMLETVREYGRQRRAEQGEDEAVRHRHREWCFNLSQEAERGLHGPDQARWLAHLAREHDNLRAALADFRAQGAARQDAQGSDPGLRFANTLRLFWEMHGHCREGRQWLQSLLAQNIGTTRERARALNNQGLLALGEANMTAAEDLFAQGLTLFRQADDRRGVSDALNNLGIVAWWHDDYARARSLYEESLTADRELDDAYSTAGVLSNLSLVAQCQGDYAQARVFLEESLALRREVGDQRGIANALLNLGVVSYDDGDDAAAWAGCEQSLALFRTLGQKDGTAVALTYLGRVAAREGDLGQARSFYQEARALAEEIGEKRRLADVLGYLADVSLSEADPVCALDLYQEQLLLRKGLGEKRMLAASFDAMARWATTQGQAEQAVRLFAAADSLRAGTGAVLPHTEREARQLALNGLGDALGSTFFADVWSQGHSMPVEQTVTMGLALSSEAAPVNGVCCLQPCQ